MTNDNSEKPVEEGKQEQPIIAINAQYIKDISFENPHSPLVLAQIKTPPKIDVAIDIKALPLESGRYEVLLKLNATAKSDEKTIYLAELVYGAIVTIQNLDGANTERTLLIYVPSLLFPFARSILGNLTRDAGLLPLMLDPIDFAALYNSRKPAEA